MFLWKRERKRREKSGRWVRGSGLLYNTGGGARSGLGVGGKKRVSERKREKREREREREKERTGVGVSVCG